MLSIIGCGRSSFEGLLQLVAKDVLNVNVVEGPVLRGYYNSLPSMSTKVSVVEGPVLRGYYNIHRLLTLLVFVVEGPVLRGYYNKLLLISL